MVFGEDLLANAYLLAAMVDHIEIVLFHTPTLHNFPSSRAVNQLKQIGADEDVSYSVHLPTYLEIASGNRKIREQSVQMVVDLINLMGELNPTYHILHVPVTRPTLTAVPGCYFTIAHQDKFNDWSLRATESLATIQDRIARKNGILVENINYSPVFLEPLWKSGICGFCLDMGHLLLGRESVLGVTRQYLSAISEIHLHGVKGHQEHLSLDVLPKRRLGRWVALLIDAGYEKVINLEVFTAQCLATSIDILMELFRGRQPRRKDVHEPPDFVAGQ